LRVLNLGAVARGVAKEGGGGLPPEARGGRFPAMLELNGTELALIVAAIALASGLLSSIVVRSGTRYAARLSGRQRATEEELRVLTVLQNALVEAASLGTIYVLNISEYERDSNGQAVWDKRRPLAEPLLTAHGRVVSLLPTVGSARVRRAVDAALVVITETMQPNVEAGHKAWQDAFAVESVRGDGVVSCAVAAVAAERRRLLDEYPSE